MLALLLLYLLLLLLHKALCQLSDDLTSKVSVFAFSCYKKYSNLVCGRVRLVELRHSILAVILESWELKQGLMVRQLNAADLVNQRRNVLPLLEQGLDRFGKGGLDCYQCGDGVWIL